MNRRKEPCRNFQRGFCQYGDRCKFLHVSQQQSKPNPFGFGVTNNQQSTNTSQQQKPNPFGFGVQNNKPSKDLSNFNTTYQSPAKPFENKWIRPSTLGSTNSTFSQQTQKQHQAASHKCTDPESCKRQITEDFNNEAPLWKLTCYGHRKDGPCDIVGDISFEELRAAAYEDARQGLSLQSIVEKERALYLSKLNEFENLLKNPYVSENSNFSVMRQSPMAINNGPLPGVQTGVEPTPTFSSFRQLGAATDPGASNRNFPFGTSSGTVFGQVNSSQSSQKSSSFEMKFGSSGVQSQLSTQPFGSSTIPNNPFFTDSNRNIGSSFPLVNQQFGGSNNQQESFPSRASILTSTVHEASVLDEQESSSDDSIWLKEQWKIGEIPERPPPDRFCK